VFHIEWQYCGRLSNVGWKVDTRGSSSGPESTWSVNSIRRAIDDRPVAVWQEKGLGSARRIAFALTVVIEGEDSCRVWEAGGVPVWPCMQNERTRE
jgi:hypothetical protein